MEYRGTGSAFDGGQVLETCAIASLQRLAPSLNRSQVLFE